MKLLPITYNKYGYRFDLYERTGDVAVYEQSEPETGKVYAYEVFIVQKNEAGFRFGKDIEASESVPNSERWGKEAYTVVGFHKISQFVQILQNRLTEKAKNQIQRGTVASNFDDLP